MSAAQPPWPDELDALVAAPAELKAQVSASTRRNMV